MRSQCSSRLLLAAALWLLGCSTPIPINTSSGVVVGQTQAGVSQFLGVPYAEPPVGDRRFRPPIEHAPWSQQRDAGKRGLSCPQPLSSLDKPADFGEDCLLLNLWTPQPSPGAGLPVMVFIHGGAFTGGSGGNALYDGTYLAKKGQVVVVTINYRLGPLGFLAHPALVAEDAHGSAGNYGLLDQQLALRWVQTNIAGFGGDPHNVTIFGESAGAGSVCAHMVSPLAAGLFHRAIAESGACLLLRTPLLDNTAQPYESAVSLGRRILPMVGCQAAADVAACLRGVSADALIATIPQQLEFNNRIASYGPNLDGYVLPASSKDAFVAGMLNRTPYLAGTNKDEGTLFTIGLSVPTRADFQQRLQTALPNHATEAAALYPESSYADPKAALTALLGDYAFTCHLRQQVRLVAAVQPHTYHYQFTKANLTAELLGLGVTHGLELPYVFHNFNFPFVGGFLEEQVSDRIIGYWTRFARTGDPNGDGAPSWPAVTTAGEYLELGESPKAGTRLKSSICDVEEPWMLQP